MRSLILNVNDGIKNLVKILLIITLFYIVLTRMIITLNQKPTKYYALRNYYEQVTDFFTKNERLYIYGSVRSSRWYSENTPENMFVFRKDFEYMCVEFKNFTHFAFDQNDLPRDPDNLLIKYVRLNKDHFTKKSLFGFDIYTLNENTSPTQLKLPCYCTKTL